MAGKGHASNFSSRTGQSDKLHPATKACTNVGSPDDPSEDEVVAWLQYPLDDAFDKSYCSDLFGQWPSGVGRTPSSAGELGTTRLSGSVGNLTSIGSAGFEDRPGIGVSQRSTSAEAALALGAGRAAGLIPHAGLEVFSKVRTAMQPPVGSQLSSLPRSSCSFPAPPSSSQNLSGKSGLSTVSSSMLPPRIRTASSLPNKLPLQPMQGGLRTVHNSSQPKAALRTEASPAGPSSNGLSCKHEQGKVQLRDRSALSGSTCRSAVSEQPFLPSFPGSRKASLTHLQTSSSQPSGRSHITEDAALRVADHSPSSSSRGHLITAPENFGTAERLPPAVVEHQGLEKKIDVFASCSGGSLTSADISMKEASSSGKQKFENSDCQSEDAEGESAETKEPPKRSSSKRHRAAEVHNLSERRRRNRINEKMKALQDLIPNSNKTDKASVLDEAIEYMKMLQLQIQMFSMRSGMSLSPMMIPVGMPHLQMAQLAPVGLGVPVGHAGVGMGMGMGMGLNMGMDLSNGVSGRSFQSLPPTFSHFGIPCQPTTAADPQNISHASSNAEFPPSDFSPLPQASPQPSEQMHVDQNNLFYYQLPQQQNQPQQDWFPGGSPSNGISDSSNEQTDN